jgi:hypothetical protein
VSWDGCWYDGWRYIEFCICCLWYSSPS